MNIVNVTENYFAIVIVAGTLESTSTFLHLVGLSVQFRSRIIDHNSIAVWVLIRITNQFEHELILSAALAQHADSRL